MRYNVKEKLLPKIVPLPLCKKCNNEVLLKLENMLGMQFETEKGKLQISR